MSRRTEQVAEEIRRHISELMLTEMRDPRVGLATVTAVQVSPDLKNARVHVSVLGSEEDETSSLRTLRRASGFLRTELAKRMVLRQVPELRFAADPTAREAAHINRLLAEVSTGSEDDAEPEG